MISVVIPCHNQAEFLRGAVESVLLQTFIDLEIVIVDDASDDDTTELAGRIIRENPTRKISTIRIDVQSGVSNARNVGIRRAGGRVILPLDADDLLHPDYIYLAMGAMRDGGDCDVVYADHLNFGESYQVARLSPMNVATMPIDNQLGTCSLYRKSLWEKVGGYRINYPMMGYEDWEFWLDCAEAGATFLHIPTVLWYYRVRDCSMSATAVENHEHLMSRIIRNHPHLYSSATVKRAAENDKR